MHEAILCAGRDIAADDAEDPMVRQHAAALMDAMSRDKKNRAGALRFWISRLWDFYLPREASMLKPHDPTHFERVLRQRIAQPLQLH